MTRIKALLSISIAALFLFAACDTNSTQQGLNPDQTDIMQSADGKQLFKGIAFGQGPVAAALPEIYGSSNHQDAIQKALDGDVASQAAERTDMSKEEIRSALQEAKQVDPAEFQRFVRSYVNQVVENISQNNPGYFSTFESRIRSGSHQKVETALASIAPILNPAIADITGRSTDQPGTPEMASEKVLFLVLFVAVAINVAAIANVNTNLNVNLTVNVNEVETEGFSTAKSNTALKRDRMVNLLVQRFATV